MKYRCRMQGCKRLVLYPSRSALMMAWHCREHYWAYVWRGYAWRTAL